ncbi:MAG TPA: undecaprenyl-diphosphate phosphatase [Candidatus Saccharimonadales bacterium]|nr:undecaprenyl-diphosphate phosphatase [Candidatus Saccharimonadales bacterium]
MDIIHAVILGIVEGLTEFLPISSTGHLLVAENLIGYKDTAEIFTVVIQTGAIFAVVWFYKDDLLHKVSGLFQRDEHVLNFWANWVIATIPAGLIGFILKDRITEYSVLWVIGAALLLGGILIWLIENYHKAAKPLGSVAQFDKIDWLLALKIGLYQILALIPGVSRSGATIMGGLLCGLDRVTATTFSFYLSIPILLLAGAYQLAKGRHELGSIAGGGLAIAVGTIVSFITALIAVKWLLKYVSKHDFKYFAYYRMVLGAVILITLLITR